MWKKQEDPVTVPKRRRNTIKNTLNTPESKKKTPLLETLMTSSDEENEYDDDSDDSAGGTPTEEGSGTRQKRGDSKDSSGASGNKIQDDI